MPILVAMAASGETFITSDPTHGLWLHLPLGARGAGPIDEPTAKKAVADHGFVSIGQEFASWRELDDYRQQRAKLAEPAVVVDRDALDSEDITELLAVARRWMAEEDGARAQRLAIELLQLPIVLGDVTLHGRIVSLLKDLSEGGLTMRLLEAPVDTQKAEARMRWQSLVPAA